MTAPPAGTFRERSYLPWIMLAVGLILGFFIGRMTYSMAQAKAGNCVSSDSSEVVATGVSAGECRDICPSCSWQQGR